MAAFAGNCKIREDVKGVQMARLGLANREHLQQHINWKRG